MDAGEDRSLGPRQLQPPGGALGDGEEPLGLRLRHAAIADRQLPVLTGPKGADHGGARSVRPGRRRGLAGDQPLVASFLEALPHRPAVATLARVVEIRRGAE